MTEDDKQQHNGGEEPEFYTEPPKMKLKDTLGVVLALVALFVIGYAGYVWLTPGKSFTTPFAKGSDTRPAAAIDMRQSAAKPGSTAAADARPDQAQNVTGAEDPAAGPVMSGMESSPANAVEDPPAAGAAGGVATATSAGQEAVPPHKHDHDMSCAYCGMFSDRSLAHAVASWSDGSHTHHDCWDCLFNYGKEHGLTLASAQVAEHGGSLDAPRWLDAGGAYFLYGTERIKGSMPPFVAAFANRDAAAAVLGQLGGEVLDFAELQAHWE